LTSTPAEKTFFKIGDSEEKQDVASYFNKTYGKKLAYPFLPCVVVQNSTFLPMEVCEVVPVSILNFAHTCY
jgi:eukaryotic translation initiation factor 2C